MSTATIKQRGPYATRRYIAQLEAALREIVRLRVATHEGSLRVRADIMWEIARGALGEDLQQPLS